MTAQTKRLLKRVKRKMDRLCEMGAGHFGHEVHLNELFDAQLDFLDWLAVEIEKCERAAVVESIRNGGPG